MSDEPADLENESTSRADPEHVWTTLSARQRETLEAVCRLERAGTRPDVVAVGDALARTPGDERVDDALEALADRNLLRIQSGCSTDRYRLTDAWWSLLRDRVDRLASACRMTVVPLEEGVVGGPTAEDP